MNEASSLEGNAAERIRRGGQGTTVGTALMEQIEGRTALITGAASGIGFAIAEALVGAGARVVVTDWDVPSLERASAQLGDATLGLRLDVTDRVGWQEAKGRAEEAFGPVDILVNNAGVAPDWRELADTAPEQFDRQVSIMLTGVFNGIHTFGADLRSRRCGHIVNTASMNGLVAVAGVGAYTAAKFGVVGLSEVLRAEMAPHGVGVSVLCPGGVRTNLLRDQPQTPPGVRARLDSGMEPRQVGDEVLRAIRADDFYVLTHAPSPGLTRRTTELMDAFDRSVARLAR